MGFSKSSRGWQNSSIGLALSTVAVCDVLRHPDVKAGYGMFRSLAIIMQFPGAEARGAELSVTDREQVPRSCARQFGNIMITDLCVRHRALPAQVSIRAVDPDPSLAGHPVGSRRCWRGIGCCAWCWCTCCCCVRRRRPIHPPLPGSLPDSSRSARPGCRDVGCICGTAVLMKAKQRAKQKGLKSCNQSGGTDERARQSGGFKP